VDDMISWGTVAWSLWKFRNGVVFKNEVSDVNSALDNRSSMMCYWFTTKMPESVIPFNAWICNPRTCHKDFT